MVADRYTTSNAVHQASKLPPEEREEFFRWLADFEYDRLGLTEETVSILGVKVPYQVMPVKPGRNLAIIIEVAARNLSLKRMGYSAAHELDRRLNEMIAQNSSNGDSANS